ncbi:Quinolinate synthase, chloroplastic [Capsicum annuum]|uniref:quinolinate synthase, chloroplastic n=1 Tax=Capsicum annuum TaxID=4072 RepID=UPI0007BF1322|nr:quinolinate synthase, chloroplastic [Capsicum annuum]KAF3624493.1 Quinolinate synthase, chloroplastic [Capsicum annuum]
MDAANLAMVSSFSKTPSPLSTAKPITRAPFSVFSLPSTFKPLVKCIQKPSNSTFTCSAVTSFPSHSDVSSSSSSSTKLKLLISEFKSLVESIDRVKRLLHYAALVPPMDASLKTTENRVPGCTAQVWLHVSIDEEGKMRFLADSDSEMTKGFCACLVWMLDGAAPGEVLALKTEDLNGLNVVGLNGKGSASRVNTWHNVLVSMQKRTRAVVAESQGRPRSGPFPSLVVTADGIQPKGSYAESQARFLFPDESRVQELVNVLKEKKIGVVAHFYMDPEVQGVLTEAQKFWPHIHISDSLVMADSAVNMAKSGCQFISVLGVDFMSENVRAILDQAGFPEVGVYRMSDERIGCSLAEAASSPSYMDYLATASISSPSLHVVYINTSLETKAFSHELVPTITCTSSNVVQTILQAFAEVPDLKVWYGPDTYMGSNIMELFSQMSMMTDEEISEIHPLHNRSSIKSLLPRLHYFQDGTCIVHHLFGHEVVETINEMYSDAFLTAHFEVPGEMFSLAMEAKKRGMGVVGSTQNILDFIKQRVQEALNRNIDEHLQFILGTESGMITSIVAAVRKLLGSADPSSGGGKVSVEIVFPVSSESVTRTSTFGEMRGSLKVNVIPGVASGEGCSLHGGCASCPYMKMNSLSSLLRVCHSLPHNKAELSAYEAARFSLQTPKGKQIADIGCQPILHMRHFQATKRLPEQLINQILQPCDNGRSGMHN